MPTVVNGCWAGLTDTLTFKLGEDVWRPKKRATQFGIDIKILIRLRFVIAKRLRIVVVGLNSR